MSQLIQDRSKKIGILTVAALFVVTAIAHLVTRSSDALPTPVPAPATSASVALVTLASRLDRTRVLQGSDGLVKVELALKAVELPGTGTRTPTDMIVVLDRSGSMDGDKIAAARAAVQELIHQLDSGDRLALVAFSSGAEVLIPLAEATAEAKSAWRRRVSEISAGGGTNMSWGLDIALELAGKQHGRMSRMLLISDGEANEGDSSPEGLRQRALEASRSEMVLSSIGVGEHFNEYLMTSLADAGTGNYYYLNDTGRLAEVFANEFDATRETVASALAVVIEPEPGVEVLDAAGYPLEKTGNTVTFRPGTLFAGQERRIWITLRLPADEIGERSLGTFRATYRHEDVERSLALPKTLQIACVEDRESWIEGIDKASWERSVVEEDYGRLREKVAGHVKSGRREEALKEIREYSRSNSALNQSLESAEVASNLEEVEKLEAEVEDAFEGEEALRIQKQNVLSKKQQALSRDLRRIGAKKKGN